MTYEQFDASKFDEYIHKAAARENFGQFKLVRACIVKNHPALVLSERLESKSAQKRAGGETRTQIYVCTSRSMSRWAVIGANMGEFRFVTDHETTDLLESILYWVEFHGLPKAQPDAVLREEFNVSDALVRFSHFGGLTPLQAAKLVSLILAKDGERIDRFWQDRAIERAASVNQANVESEAASAPRHDSD